MCFRFVVGLIFLICMPAPAQGSERVTWFFHMPSCSACIEKQVSMMRRFAKPGDTIRFIEHDKHAASKDVVKTIKTAFDVNSYRMEVVAASDGQAWQGVGFDVDNKANKENISFRAKSGFYDTVKAEAILTLYRFAKGSMD